MKYEIEIVKAWGTDKRINSNRECALRIFKNELKQAVSYRDNNVRGYFYKVYTNGTKSLVLSFDTYYSKELKKVF